MNVLFLALFLRQSKSFYIVNTKSLHNSLKNKQIRIKFERKIKIAY